MTLAELRAQSAFSFRRGAATPEALVERAAELGYPALGLTDEADWGGVVRFVEAARSRGIRPVVGAELRVEGRPAAFLVKDREGCRNLAALITEARTGAWGEGWSIEGSLERRGLPGISWARVRERAGGLWALTGPPSGELGTLLREGRRADAVLALRRWRESFGERLAVEVQLHHAGGEESALAGALVELAEREGVPWVACQNPCYVDEEGRLVHDLFTALRAGHTLPEAAGRGVLRPNGEWRLRAPWEMQRLWKGRERGLEQSWRIASQCDFHLSWLRPPLPRFRAPRGHDDASWLREQVLAGARERWGERLSPEQRRQIEHELEVVGRLGFAGFFLVMWDAVRWARERGILCQGRGSAANSAVAYCLGITAVDPVRHGLLFERFLSEVRVDGQAEAPDIDVDVEHDRREELLERMYATYDRSRSAIACTVQCYRAPSALQDAMRALGYPAEQARTLSKRLHGHDPRAGAEYLEGELAGTFGLHLADARGRALLRAMRALDGLPRQRATHVGGFVLSAALLGEHAPIEPTPMGRTILQFDKDDLDAIGIPKFDFLGLGGLSLVRRAFDTIEVQTGTRPEMYTLPQDDRKTYEMIARGDTVGTFQIESRAQIASILQTRPERLYDLVVQVALIRPGPIQGEFVHPYTRRRRGLERVTYRHPALRPILERTQGIPIFQEQAMQISMALGGFTAAEADELRRTMGHQRKLPRLLGALQRLERRMEQRGVDPETAADIVADLRGFANYGFPESHAWSFALIAYATAYLKANHPEHFYAALLNSYPMGFYSPATLMHQAMREGVEVRGPCLKEGEWECTLEGAALRIGLRHVRGLGERTRERLQAAREEGPFTGVEDVVRRAGLAQKEALHLARAGAMEALQPGRRAAAWEALRAAGDTLPLAPARRLPFDPRELENDELVFLDYLATGISLHGHPVQHLRARLDRAGATHSTGLRELEDGDPVVVGGLVVIRQRPQSAHGTIFLLLEDEHGLFNVVVPKQLVEANREVVKHAPFVLVEGRVGRDGEVISLIGRRFRQLRVQRLEFRSRDFR